jgi:hypothetical protein
MSSTDGKLYRIFVVAGEQRASSRADLSRSVASRCFEEFSYEEEGERKYHNWKTVQDYVAFACMVGLLDGDLQPYVTASNVTKRGFEHALGEKVENFAEAHGFSEANLRSAMKALIQASPSRLPTPKAVHQYLRPKCDYHIFFKAVSVRAFQDRTSVSIRSRATFLATDIFQE